MRARVSPDPRVIVIDSYDFNLCVRRGHVVVKSAKTERVISRMDAAKTRDGVARIIILSHVGTISVKVLQWAESLDIGIAQVSRDGSIGFVSPGPMSSDARIAKQQVLAGEGMPSEQRGMALTRTLLTAKLHGQRNIVREMFRADTPVIDSQIEILSKAESLRAMLAAEGNAANPYWRLWKDRVFVPWELAALRVVPNHWSRFNARAGVRTVANGYSNTSNRNATDFVNACLNYGYKIAETEALYACHVLGLHPGIGVQHGTHDGMAGMALDLMEPLRPIVDRTVLSYLDYGNGIPFDDTGKPAYIGKRSAYELEDGTCRLFPPMTTNLATAVSMAVAPEAMRYAEIAVKSLTAGSNAGRMAPKDTRLRKRPMAVGNLASCITVSEIITDSLWAAVANFVPVRHSTGITVDERTILAGIAAHEIYGVSWPGVEVLGVDGRTCQSRLALWEKTGVWSKIRGEITRPGVSRFDTTMAI
jgi:CRISPR-associated protein Cas1